MPNNSIGEPAAPTRRTPKRRDRPQLFTGQISKGPMSFALRLVPFNPDAPPEESKTINAESETAR